jgi:phosphatidylserine decarboxylase
LFLAILALILIIFNVLFWIYFPSYICWGLLAVSLVFFIFFTQFFRSPKRDLTIQDKAIVSPADGTIVVIGKTFEDEYLKQEVLQISVFMSPLNVHLNRVPLSGIVEYYKYHKGKYLVAFHPKSSLLNERTTCVIRNAEGQKVLMRQIAGAVARRIRFFLTPGQEVKQGEELGFIKFGSRMDVFLPLDTKVNIEMGQKIKGGVTVLATLS